MAIDIEALIEQRPHLKDPLEFYDRCQRFQIQAAELLSKNDSTLSTDDTRAYPREMVDDILHLFSTVFDLQENDLEPIGQALKAGELDFMRLPLEEIPPLSSPYDENELASILFLLSRSYFLALKKASQLDDQQWEGGRCPLCSAKASLASITEGPQRLLHCSWCGTSGTYQFLGCPNCGSRDASKLSTLVPDEEPGFRVSTCDECQSYLKIVEGPILSKMSMDLADLASLPLDIVAQEKGYGRATPNPIGLKKIT